MPDVFDPEPDDDESDDVDEEDEVDDDEDESLFDAVSLLVESPEDEAEAAVEDFFDPERLSVL